MFYTLVFITVSYSHVFLSLFPLSSVSASSVLSAPVTFHLLLLLYLPAPCLLCFLIFCYHFSSSLSHYLPTSLSLSLRLFLEAFFSLPACMMACSWEPLFLCKLLAWLQQYLKLNHKLCCQTNRQALGQHGSAVFFCLFFFFAFVLVVFGEGGCADPSSQPQQALGFRWPGSSGGVGRRVMWRMKGPTDMRDSAADPETAQNSSRGVKQSY